MPRPATRDEVVAAVRSLPDGLRFVGVDGFGAAGKTSLAEAIAAADPRVAVVHLDDLQGEGITQWEWDRFAREIVTPLRAGCDARYALWSWGDSAPNGVAEVAAGAVVVVEGVSATRREADVAWDLTVWVDTPEAVRRRRALDRDGPESERIWREHWIPPEEAYAGRERPRDRVDLVVDGTGGLEDLGQSSTP